jgi:hypothetical protein
MDIRSPGRYTPDCSVFLGFNLCAGVRQDHLYYRGHIFNRFRDFHVLEEIMVPPDIIISSDYRLEQTQ